MLDVDLSTVPEKEFVLMHSPSGIPYHRLTFAVEIIVEDIVEQKWHVIFLRAMLCGFLVCSARAVGG